MLGSFGLQIQIIWFLYQYDATIVFGKAVTGKEEGNVVVSCEVYQVRWISVVLELCKNFAIVSQVCECLGLLHYFILDNANVKKL